MILFVMEFLQQKSSGVECRSMRNADVKEFFGNAIWAHGEAFGLHSRPLPLPSL